jgi:hypothetical protein
MYYRVRHGRSLSLTHAEALPRDWAEAYIHWHRERGELEHAVNLQWHLKKTAHQSASGN